jgi:N,N'-diacetyllegionaminate synthase
MTKIIAEIGWNHMGDMNLAKKMIAAAAAAGADIVKFQTWKVKNLKEGPWDNDGRRQIYEKAELTEDNHYELYKESINCGVSFMTSVFDINDVDFIFSVSNNIIKIPSPEATNHELIYAVSKKFNEVLVSVGATNWSEIKKLVQYSKLTDLTILHCVSAYPCNPEKINLPRIKILKTIHNQIGYSGHLNGINDAIAAISLDLKYVEKHFTIDNSLPGRDNKFAILPKDLKVLSLYRDTYKSMSISHGSDSQLEEKEVAEIYRGRWSKNK